MRRLFVPVLLVLPLAASCAPTADQPPGEQRAAATRVCFNIDQVQSFGADGQDRVTIRTLGNRVYELRASGGCQDLSHATGIGLRPGRGLDRLCVGESTHIDALGAGASISPCWATVERQLTPEQIEALPPRLKP